MPDFRLHDRKSFRHGLELAILERLKIAAYHGQWITQVMGNIRGHLLSRLICEREIRAHLVEGVRQFTQFIR